MAELIGLDRRDTADSVIDQEVKLRVWWSLYMVDLWCISGQGLKSHMGEPRCDLLLPMRESVFASLPISSKHQALVIDDRRQPGLLAQEIGLVPLFGLIHSLNQDLAAGKIDEVEQAWQVECIEQKLLTWQNQLPHEAQMDPDNLYRLQSDGFGGLLISIHLTYHLFATLLYFPYLELDHSSTAQSKCHQSYGLRCKQNASALSALLRQSRQLKRCDIVYPNVGSMLVVSSVVLISSLLFGTDPGEIASARRDLNSNFEALVELAQWWPSCADMVS